MELVGQMYKLSACFDTPNEYKGLPYDYFPEEAVTYGSTVCSFGLSYNDHNYGMPIGLTPPVMAPHLMDPVPKPKKTISSFNPQWTKMDTKCEPGVGEVTIIKTESEVVNSTDSSSTCNPSSNNCTPRKQYLDENDYPVYVEPEIKVVEVPSNLCVSASEYSDCSTESSDDGDGGYNPDFINYLKSLSNKKPSVEKYLTKAKQKFERCAPSQRSSGSEKKESIGVPDFVIDCICEYSYDDKRMVQCEACGVRQHIDCMYTNPRQVQNFLKHRCHKCSDITVDVTRAKAIQQSRKNWHLTADRIAQKNKFGKPDDVRRPREFMVNFREIKTDRKASDHSKSKTSCSDNPAIGRVNKRKQDLKACIKPVLLGSGNIGRDRGSSMASGDASSNHSSDGSHVCDVLEANPSTMDTGDTVDARQPLVIPTVPEVPEETAVTANDEMVSVVPPTHTSIPERPQSLINRRSQPMKKDYKEASKSLYSTNLLKKLSDKLTAESAHTNSNNEHKDSNKDSVDQGSEFLDRNPRCRIVIFDSCTMGIEASVRLQAGSIVSALYGKMMLMDEYLVCTNPTTEYRPYVFLYHNFGDNGLVIDCSNYGNITRYLRRSCDPNAKLEHTIIGGSLYVVIRTTAEVFQGVELTMPFDVPFELCQFPVQCACGKVRCPAVKHRRKHHRSRVIPSNINCEQVIEDKLRELSQPLNASPGGGGGGNSVSGGPGNSTGGSGSSVYSSPGMKKSVSNLRYGMSQHISPYRERLITALSQLPITTTPGRFYAQHSAAIVKKESTTEPIPIRSVVKPQPLATPDTPVVADSSSSCSDDDSVKTTPSKQVHTPPSSIPGASRSPVSTTVEPASGGLSATPILASKRRPKPVLHPDFETDFDAAILNRQQHHHKQHNQKPPQQVVTGGTSANVASLRMKKEPIVSAQLNTPNKSENGSDTPNKSEISFKSIITTRRQKQSDKAVKSGSKSPITNLTPKKSKKART